jgi:hypothetical protein
MQRIRTSPCNQLDQGFPWSSSVLEQMLSWYQNSTLHCLLHMQPSQWKHQHFALTWPSQSKVKISIRSSKAPGQFPSSARNKLHFLELYPSSKIHLPEGRTGITWEPSKQEYFSVPFEELSVSHYPLPFTFSPLLFPSLSLFSF